VLPWSPDMEWWPWQETPVRHGVPPPNYSSWQIYEPFAAWLVCTVYRIILAFAALIWS
jgi:hypothetical protein